MAEKEMTCPFCQGRVTISENGEGTGFITRHSDPACTLFDSLMLLFGGSGALDVAYRRAREHFRTGVVHDGDDTPDDVICASCGHTRGQHCGCGRDCLATKNEEPTAEGFYRCCNCNGFQAAKGQA